VPSPISPETAVLRALANPTRQDILDLLARGPATSAMVARALDSNTGVASYHLRELGGAGLIERDPERSRGRHLYWRVASGDVRFRDPAQSDDPVLARAAIDLIMARLTASLRAYLGRTDLDDGWREASLFSRSTVDLSAVELAGFQRDYLELVSRWAGRAPSSATKPVRLALFAFPDDPEGTAA
jgi:DNA-binding transcriptional ArsR family regulator